MRFACIALFASLAQAFLVPAPKYCRTKVMSSPKPSMAGVMQSTSPFAGRTLQLSDLEDSTERLTTVQLNPDGSITMVGDSTKPVDIQGNWQTGEDNKVGFLLERFYSDSPDSTYSFTRIYEGRVKISGGSLRGSGKIEMEKYGDLITVGYFSFISCDDDDSDDFFKKIRHTDALDGMVEGLDY